MKKIIFSSILMFITLFFLIVKLSSIGTSATRLPVSTTNSLSTTKNTGATNTTMMNQKQTVTGTTTRPMTARMTRTS